VAESAIDQAEWLRIRAQLATAFNPSGPVSSRDLFAGRIEQISRVLSAVSQRGQSVILFGERGVGKTSLASLVHEFWNDLARESENYVLSARYNCDPADTFISIWSNLAEIINDVYEQRGDQHPGGESWLELFAEIRNGAATPHAVRRLLTLAAKRFIVVIDEFDQIQDPACTQLFASTMKAISDHLVPATLILVGVADNVDDLIADHASIDRSTIQVLMPRMAPAEIKSIISQGYGRVGLQVDDAVLDLMARLVQGLPHYAHRFGQEAGYSAVDRRSRRVAREDVERAVRKAVELTEESIRSAFRSATTSPQAGNLFSKVLVSCALAPVDDLGYFAAGDVRDPLEAVAKRRYEIPQFIKHLKRFAKGGVLELTGDEWKRRYRFANPLMRPYAVLRGMEDGLIDEEIIKRFERPERDVVEQRRLL